MKTYNLEQEIINKSEKIGIYTISVKMLDSRNAQVEISLEEYDTGFNPICYISDILDEVSEETGVNFLSRKIEF